MLPRNSGFVMALVLACSPSVHKATSSSCANETLPDFLDLRSCFVIPQDLCSNPDMLLPFAENLITCAVASISDLGLPSKLFLMEGIVTPVLESFGFGTLVKALFGICKTVGSVTDTLDTLTLGITGVVLDPVKQITTAFLPIPDCSASSIKGTVKCGKSIPVTVPSSVKQCFSYVQSTCSGTKANKGPALVDLFKTVSCISEKAIDATTPEGITSLACGVLTGWAKSARVLSGGILGLLPLPIPGISSGSGASGSSDDEEKPQGLVSTLVGGLTGSGSDSTSENGAKPEGLVSTLVGSLTGSGSSTADDGDKPQGLVSTLLGDLTGSGSDSTSGGDDKPEGLVSTLPQEQRPEQQTGSSPQPTSNITVNTTGPSSEPQTESSPTVTPEQKLEQQSEQQQVEPQVQPTLESQPESKPQQQPQSQTQPTQQDSQLQPEPQSQITSQSEPLQSESEAEGQNATQDTSKAVGEAPSNDSQTIQNVGSDTSEPKTEPSIIENVSTTQSAPASGDETTSEAQQNGSQTQSEPATKPATEPEPATKPTPVTEPATTTESPQKGLVGSLLGILG